MIRDARVSIKVSKLIAVCQTTTKVSNPRLITKARTIKSKPSTRKASKKLSKSHLPRNQAKNKPPSTKVKSNPLKNKVKRILAFKKKRNLHQRSPRKSVDGESLMMPLIS